MENRANYKATWEALATTSKEARLSVAGHLDDAEWARSALTTLRILRSYVGVYDNDEVLEIGCGIGRVGRMVAPRCSRWTGVDISGSMIAMAREELGAFENVRLIELQEPDLSSFPPNSFDLVYCTVVFMHLYEWDRFRYVQEAHRVLRPGGRCYFDNVDITTDHGWSVFMAGAAYAPANRPAHLSMVSSGDELATYGRRAGFGRVKIRRWGGAWVAMTGQKLKS